MEVDMNTRYSSRDSKIDLKRSLLGSRGLLFGCLLLLALICFESFNFSTTQVALKDILGPLKFAGISWATILTIAFCGIDFAGIARQFIQDDRSSSVTTETWYLFGAWLLAATMNALLTWWGVSLSLVNRTLRSTAFISQGLLLDIVPIFIALLVWLIRILLIGTFTIAGPRLFSTLRPDESRISTITPIKRTQTQQPIPVHPRPSPLAALTRSRQTPMQDPVRPEPEYIPDPSYVTMQPAAHALSGTPRAEPSASRRVHS